MSDEKSSPCETCIGGFIWIFIGLIALLWGLENNNILVAGGALILGLCLPLFAAGMAVYDAIKDSAGRQAVLLVLSLILLVYAQSLLLAVRFDDPMAGIVSALAVQSFVIIFGVIAPAIMIVRTIRREVKIGTVYDGGAESVWLPTWTPPHRLLVTPRDSESQQDSYSAYEDYDVR